MSVARIVGFTSLDLDRLLPLVQKLTNRNIATTADSKNLAPPKHTLQCFAEFQNTDVLSMLDLVVLFVSDNRDSAELISALSMDTLMSRTVNRDFDCVIAKGSLVDWGAAFRRGLNASDPVHDLFLTAYYQFGERGLTEHLPVVPKDTRLLLLEHKR